MFETPKNRFKRNEESLAQDKTQDKFEQIVYGLAQRTGERLEADLEGLEADSDADRLKAKLRCEEDCQIMAEIWKIHSDSELIAFTTSILEYLKKQQGRRRVISIVILIVLAVLMVTGAALTTLFCSDNNQKIVCVIIAGVLASASAFSLLRYINSTKDSSVSIERVLETLLAIRTPREGGAVATSREEAILELVNKLFPDR